MAASWLGSRTRCARSASIARSACSNAGTTCHKETRFRSLLMMLPGALHIQMRGSHMPGHTILALAERA